MTLDNYNALFNWNYSFILRNTNVNIEKVFENLQKFSLYQVKCIESHLEYKFRFRKRFTLNVKFTGDYSLTQDYYCMHQHMPKDNSDGIPSNTKDLSVKEAVKDVINFKKNVDLYDTWVGPLILNLSKALGKEKMPEYKQEEENDLSSMEVIDVSFSQYVLI